MPELNKLETEILNFLRNEGYVSFVELEKAFSQHKGNFEITTVPENVEHLRAPKGANADIKRMLAGIRKKRCALLWSGFSSEFVDAFMKLINEGYISFNPTMLMKYFVDGIVLTVDNWLPVILNILPKKEENL